MYNYGSFSIYTVSKNTFLTTLSYQENLLVLNDDKENVLQSGKFPPKSEGFLYEGKWYKATKDVAFCFSQFISPLSSK